MSVVIFSYNAELVRYTTKQRVKKLILVAPAKVVGNSKKSLKEIQELEIEPEWRSAWTEFHNFKSDPSIKDRVDQITIFYFK